MTEQLDARDAAILAERIAARDGQAGARTGDFVQFPDGTMARFAYEWPNGLQSCPGGSFYLTAGGYLSMSGSLDRVVPSDTLTDTGQVKAGRAWFFHHDWHTAGNSVPVSVPCRVYSTTADAPARWQA